MPGFNILSASSALLFCLLFKTAPRCFAQCVGVVAGIPPTQETDLCGVKFLFWASVDDFFGNLFYAAGDNVYVKRVDGTCDLVTGGPGAESPGDGRPAALALTAAPHDITIDPATNDLIIADTLNHRIRRISYLSGFIETIAGNGIAPCSAPDGLSALAACLYLPASVVVTSAGNVLFGEAGAHRVRILYKNGTLGSFAGNGTRGYCGDGGAAATACFDSGFDPEGSPEPEQRSYGLKLVLNSAGDVYISDYGNNRVRRIEVGNGLISTVAGSGARGFSGDGGPATLAELGLPAGLAFQPEGGLLVADYANARVRCISPDGKINAWLGNGEDPMDSNCREDGPSLDICTAYPYGISVSTNGTAFVSTQSSFNRQNEYVYNGFLLSVFNGTVKHVLAKPPAIGCFPAVGALAIKSCLSTVKSPVLDAAENLIFVHYVTDQVYLIRANDSRVELVAGNGSIGSSGDNGPATDALLHDPENIAIDITRGRLFIADTSNVRVRMVDLETGIIFTVVGNGSVGFSGDGGPAINATLDQDASGLNLLFVSVGIHGELYITDPGNSRIRIADVGGIISTFAGKGERGFCGDGGPALEACFDGPYSTAIDPISGDLYLGDLFNRRVRRVSSTTGIIDTVVGTGAQGPCGSAGTGLSICICPNTLNVDSAGRVYISDSARCSNVIFRFDPANGNVTTVVGNGGPPRVWCNNTDALEVCLSAPQGVAFTAGGNLLIADSFNGLLREAVFGGTPNCLPGCLCPCATPQPCVDLTHGFCPGGAQTSAFPVSAGYYAVADRSAGGLGGFFEQRPCPIGAYCIAGVVLMCPVGTYGIAGAQKAVSGCAICPASSYNPEVGRVGIIACVPCPAGSASVPGAAFCPWCLPNSAAGAAALSCMPCPAGFYALFGASSCSPLPATASAFEATTFGAAVHYPPPFSYFVGSAFRLQSIVAGATAAVIFILVIMLLVLLNCNLASSAFRERVARLMRLVDSFSEARAINDGEPRVKRLSALGGVITVAAFGSMAAVASAIITEYAQGNFIVLSSALPSTTTALEGVDALPFRSRALTGPLVPPELPSHFTSGLLVRLSAQGSACDNLSSNTNASGLTGGAWFMSSSADPHSNLHVFDLTCPECTFGPLSLVDVSLDGRCQAITVLVASVGARGDVTLYSFATGGAPETARYLSEFALVAPPTLDVLYDTAVLHESMRGLLLVGASANNPTIIDQPPTTVRILVSLAAQGTLVQTRVDPVISPAQLISSITGLAGLLGIFATAFTFTDGNRATFRRLIESMRCNRSCSCLRWNSKSAGANTVSESVHLVSMSRPRNIKASGYAGL